MTMKATWERKFETCTFFQAIVNSYTIAVFQGIYTHLKIVDVMISNNLM